jgi:dethiobiotin synthetase
MHRYFVTGTDTDVGKTRVTAALALAMKEAGLTPVVVKFVQTGLAPGMTGDAALAGKLSGARALELARFEKAADPWSAALAERRPEVLAGELVEAIAHIKDNVVSEGAGGLMVPLNAREHFGNIAVLGKFTTVLAVGLRLGCVNHALLTAAQCQQAGIDLAGAVLVERWSKTDPGYAEDVVRTLQGKLKILGIMPYDEDEAASVRDAAKIFAPFFR